MATLALTIIGTNSGWSALTMALATMAGNYIDQKIFGTPVELNSKMSDLTLTTATAGAAINKTYGTVRCGTNVIWGTNYVEHKNESSSSGKGGGTTYVEYTYTSSFAVGICEGPITGIDRVWFDGNLVDLSDYTWTLYLGTETQEPDSFIEGIQGAGTVPAHRGLAYIVFQDINVTNFGNRIPNVSIEVTKGTTTLTFTSGSVSETKTYTLDNVDECTGISYSSNELTTLLSKIDSDYEAVSFSITDGTANLADVVLDISEFMNLSSSDVDVTGLSDYTIQGYLTDGTKTGREQIQQLQSYHIFDGIEIDGQVVFKFKDFDNVYSIALEDMGAYESTRPDEPFEDIMTPDSDLPKSVTLNFLSYENDFLVGSITARRKATSSVIDTSVSVNFVLKDAKAKATVETLLYEAWIGRHTYKIPLTSKYAYLKAGDIVELELPNDQTKLAMITKTTYGSPGLMKIEARSTYASTYTIVERTVDTTTTNNSTTAPTSVTCEFLDIPQLPADTTTTTNDTVYVATTADVFYGANVYKSVDDGVSYSSVLTGNPQAVMGTTSTVLGDGPTAIWDNANTLTVVLTAGTLSSYEKSSVLNWSNLALVGNELIQFRKATLTAALTYKLSGLLRGRLGTESYTSTHNSGERFILLTSSTIGGMTVTSSEWYKARYYLVGPKTKANTDSTYTTSTFTANGIMAKPLSVCHVKGTRDSSGNLTLTWVRRTRGLAEWLDYADVAINETTEAYEIDILDGTTVVRTLSVTAAEVTYSATNQVSDFGSAQSSITADIYQISETRGRGYVKEVTL